MRGTIVVKPDRQFDAAHSLALIGRPVRVLYFGHSSGPGDIAVFDEDTGTLFAGGLLDQGRISDVQDSDLAGWTLALTTLRALPVRRVVPGHGPAADAGLINTIESYLAQLQAGALKLLEAGAALSEVPDGLQIEEFKDWDQYDTIHRRNAALVFLRLEQQRLMR
jgi:glyoxylase-like metal-dependent hydrolase (beta-lactamase superfamily II)